MIGSYTKIYRACFLAPMLGPHHFAALLEGGGGGAWGDGGRCGGVAGWGGDPELDFGSLV